MVAWVNDSAWPSGKTTILSAGNTNFKLGFDNGRPTFGFDASLTSSTALPVNEWHRVAWRYFKPTNEHAIFVDGVEVLRSTSVTYPYADLANESLTLGDAFNISLGRTSSLDEVEIFPYPVSDEALGGSRVNEDGQVFYFNFEKTPLAEAGTQDNSLYANQINCQPLPDGGNWSDQCPDTTDNIGFVGNSYSFGTESGSQADILVVQPTPNLDLSRGDGAFTISVWLKKQQDAAGWLLGGNGFPSLNVNGASASAQFPGCSVMADNIADFTAGFADSVWQNLIATFDGVTFSLYVNNRWLDSVDCSGKRPDDVSTFFMGNSENSSSNAYDGELDELRIFNYGLNPEQIADLFWDSTPMLEMRFDEAPARTEFVDRSLTPHSGTCIGDTCPISGVQGRNNQALLFDGADDQISLTTIDTLDMTDRSFTVSAWVKPDALNYRVILGTDNTTGNEYMRLNIDDGLPSFSLPAAEIIGTTFMQVGQWTHLVGRYEYNPLKNSGTATLFMDGVVAGVITETGALQGSAPLLLGAADSASTHFAGMIDQLQIFRQALSNAQIQELRDQMPIVNLHLDERDATTSFANEAVPAKPATCTGDACPDAGIKGKIYQGAAFDGENDQLTLPHQMLETFSMGAWVKPLGQKSVEQPILDKTGSRTNGNTFPILRLAIAPNSMKVTVHAALDAVFGGCTTTSATSNATLIQNAWNHVMVTYDDGGEVVLYMNGTEVLRRDYLALFGPCSQSQPFNIGNSTDSATTSPFAGEMDEIVVYPSALSKQDVADFVAYQSSWFDTSYAHNILIDADLPTVSLGIRADYLPNQSIILAAQAHDATTLVEKVEYNINGAGWQAATRDNELWLFTFTPTADGDYTIALRATDTAGNVGTNDVVVARSAQTNGRAGVSALVPTAGEIIRIDSTPPTIGTASVESSQPSVSRNQNGDGWVASLSGTVTESGSPVDNVHITLQDSTGLEVNGRQRALLTGSGTVSWAMNYPFDARPNGVFTHDRRGRGWGGQRGRTGDRLPPGRHAPGRRHPLHRPHQHHHHRPGADHGHGAGKWHRPGHRPGGDQLPPHGPQRPLSGRRVERGQCAASGLGRTAHRGRRRVPLCR